MPDAILTRLNMVNERQMLFENLSMLYVWNVEGFRASSYVRKSYMQGPAWGSLWSIGISDSVAANAVHGRLPERVR